VNTVIQKDFSMPTFEDVAPVVPVRDLQAALDRYRQLGFEVRAYGHGTGYGYARRGAVSIHLSALTLAWFARGWAWFIAARKKIWRWISKRAVPLAALVSKR
jgi:hypothetical protein